MKSKMFQDLKKGDRFLIPLCDWVVADGFPRPIDGIPSGLWKVSTTTGRAFYYPEKIVAVEN